MLRSRWVDNEACFMFALYIIWWFIRVIISTGLSKRTLEEVHGLSLWGLSMFGTFQTFVCFCLKWEGQARLFIEKQSNALIKTCQEVCARAIYLETICLTRCAAGKLVVPLSDARARAASSASLFNGFHLMMYAWGVPGVAYRQSRRGGHFKIVLPVSKGYRIVW